MFKIQFSHNQNITETLSLQFHAMFDCISFLKLIYLHKFYHFKNIFLQFYFQYKNSLSLYWDFSISMTSLVGSVFFSMVSVWVSCPLSYFSIPSLNFMCSISWAMASVEGREFFSSVSAFFSVVLSNSFKADRLDSRAFSVCKNRYLLRLNISTIYRVFIST